MVWLEFGCGEVGRFEDFPSAMVKPKGMKSVDEIVDIRCRAADFFRLLFEADNHFGGGGVGDLEVTDDEGEVENFEHRGDGCFGGSEVRIGWIDGFDDGLEVLFFEGTSIVIDHRKYGSLESGVFG